MRRKTLGTIAILAWTLAGTLTGEDAPVTAPEVTPTPAQPAAKTDTPAPTATPAAAATPTPAAPKVAPAVAALQPSDAVLTLTLDNYNQIVAILREKDATCLTLETAEGLMKLRIDKVLNVVPGGTLKITQGTGGTTGGSGSGITGGGGGGGLLSGPGSSSTGSSGAAAGTIPLSQMTPDERIKAAKEKLKANDKAVLTYQQAIQNRVGGVPQGVLPSQFAAQQRNNQNAPPSTAGNRNWQPFSSDNPQANNNQNTPTGAAQNQAYWQQQQQYQNFLGNNGQNGYGYMLPYAQTYVPLQHNGENR